MFFKSMNTLFPDLSVEVRKKIGHKGDFEVILGAPREQFYICIYFGNCGIYDILNSCSIVI